MTLIAHIAGSVAERIHTQHAAGRRLHSEAAGRSLPNTTWANGAVHHLVDYWIVEQQMDDPKHHPRDITGTATHTVIDRTSGPGPASARPMP